MPVQVLDACLFPLESPWRGLKTYWCLIQTFLIYLVWVWSGRGECHRSFGIVFFSGYMPRSGTAGSYGDSSFCFLRKFHTVFPSGCTDLLSHQFWLLGESSRIWWQRVSLGLPGAEQLLPGLERAGSARIPRSPLHSACASRGLPRTPSVLPAVSSPALRVCIPRSPPHSECAHAPQPSRSTCIASLGLTDLEFPTASLQTCAPVPRLPGCGSKPLLSRAVSSPLGVWYSGVSLSPSVTPGLTLRCSSSPPRSLWVRWPCFFTCWGTPVFV